MIGWANHLFVSVPYFTQANLAKNLAIKSFPRITRNSAEGSALIWFGLIGLGLSHL